MRWEKSLKILPQSVILFGLAADSLDWSVDRVDKTNQVGDQLGGVPDDQVQAQGDQRSNGNLKK